MTTTTSETLYDSLVAIDGLKTCQDVGCRKSGLPRSLHPDGMQEMSIALWKKEIDGDWDNGQCMSYTMTMCKRVGVNMRRRMSQQTTIPQDVFQAFDVNAYQTKVDVTEELTEKTVASFGIMSSDERDPERNALSILSSLPAPMQASVDAALKELPRSLITMMYYVVVLNETVATASDRMGVDPATGEKYVTRIIKEVNEHKQVESADMGATEADNTVDALAEILSDDDAADEMADEIDSLDDPGHDDFGDFGDCVYHADENDDDDLAVSHA